MIRRTVPLDLRPDGECCDQALPNGDPAARIGTVCAPCVHPRLGGFCRDRGGDLVLRPTGPAGLLPRPLSANQIAGDHAGSAG